MLPEVLCHRQDVLPRIRLIAAGPEQNRHMVFIPLKHRLCPVQHTGFPFLMIARHIPGRLHHAQLLPGAVAFHICLIHHIDAVFVTHLIPYCLVGIMAGTDRIDMVSAEYLHRRLHILPANHPAMTGIPLMAVHAFNHQALPVQQHQAVLQFEAAETDLIRHGLRHLPIGCHNSQRHLVQFRRLMAPEKN